MSPWKVILATLVIFCSGLAVGALIVKRTARTIITSQPSRVGTTNAPLSLWHQQQKEFLRRMDRELSLSPEQQANIGKTLKESQERTKGIREKIAPEMREELKKVREQIQAELTPEQREHFEKAMRSKISRKPDDSIEERRKKDGLRRQRTNAPSTNVISPAL